MHTLYCSTMLDGKRKWLFSIWRATNKRCCRPISDSSPLKETHHRYHIYEYGDEDLGRGSVEGGAYKEGGRDQRVKNREQARDSVSLRGFFCLLCGPWLDLRTGFRRVCLCVCVRARASVCVCLYACGCRRGGPCRRGAGGDRSESNHTQTCSESWDTGRHSLTLI